MMKNINSILKFNNYIVNEINFRNNERFIQKDDGTSIKLNIIPEIKIDKKNMDIVLEVEDFKDAEENNYPFEITMSVTGKFECEGEEPEKFIKNAIAILYPYIRAIVSTYTASANVNALILPAINVNKLIEDNKEN